MAKIDPHKRFRSKEDFNPTSYFDSLLKKIEQNRGKIFVAEINSKIVGYIMGIIETFDGVDAENKYLATQGYIEGLFVDEDHRGQSVSAALVKTMEEYFRNAGCDYSSVACVAANQNARDFYTKTGYGEQYIDYLKKL